MSKGLVPSFNFQIFLRRLLTQDIASALWQN
jgi:hypothetical protein